MFQLSTLHTAAQNHKSIMLSQGSNPYKLPTTLAQDPNLHTDSETFRKRDRRLWPTTRRGSGAFFDAKWLRRMKPSVRGA